MCPLPSMHVHVTSKCLRRSKFPLAETARVGAWWPLPAAACVLCERANLPRITVQVACCGAGYPLAPCVPPGSNIVCSRSLGALSACGRPGFVVMIYRHCGCFPACCPPHQLLRLRLMQVLLLERQPHVCCHTNRLANKMCKNSDTPNTSPLLLSRYSTPPNVDFHNAHMHVHFSSPIRLRTSAPKDD